MRLWPRKQVYVDDLPQTHDLRFAGVFVVAFLALLGGLYGVGYLVAGDRLPAGTTVAGIEVGGMSSGEARSELQSTLARRLNEPLTLSAGGQSLTVDPQRAGLTFDLAATIDNGLGGNRWDPWHMLRVITGGGPIDPVVVVDQQALSATLDRLSTRTDRPPVSSQVVFRRSGPAVLAGREGRALDYDDAEERIVAALIDGDVAELDVRSVDPVITMTEASNFVRQVAAPAVSAPVRVRVASTTLSVTPKRMLPAISVHVVRGKLGLALDADALMKQTRDILGRIPGHPVSASFEFHRGRPVMVPSRSGVTVDPDNWAASVLRAATRQGQARESVAKAVPDRPRLTTQKARMLRIKEQISAGAVTVDIADGIAVRRIVAGLDGTVIRPQALFSFLSRVGARDPDASSILASAAYQAALRGGMSDIIRSSGRHYDGTSPPGMDARVENPATDLAWRNTTPYGVLLRAWVTGGLRAERATVHVEMWSSPFWQVRMTSSARYEQTPPATRRSFGSRCRPLAGDPGFEIDVERVFVLEGERQRVEHAHSEYGPRARVVCLGGQPGASR